MLNFGNSSMEQLYAAAVTHHQAGRLAQAEPLYQQILAAQPAHGDALHMLGALACQVGKFDAAIELMQRAIAVMPGNAIYHSNLGETFRKAGKEAQAEALLRRALALEPRFGDAYANLGALLLSQNRDAEAREVLQTGARQAPAHALVWRFLGDVLIRMKIYPDALAAYEQAVRLQPQLADAHFNRGVALADMGRLVEAEAAFLAVVAAEPQDWEAYDQLADVMGRQGRSAEAAVLLRNVAKANPTRAKTFYLLGGMLRNINRVDEAIEAYERCLAVTPDDNLALANLALAYRDQARLEESLALQRKALELMPTASAVHSSLIFTMHLLPNMPRTTIEAQQARWNERYVAPLAGQRLPHANDRTAGRRLRIGYVSADFRAHPVGRFMLPLLRHHNRANVEVFCYSVTRNPDQQTAILQAAADQWRHATPLGDDELAALIRADGIDVLIDLSNHTIDNRMPVFARKPAPVQVTYLAYCAGTGLSTMDWRLTDPHIDPPGREADAAPFERPLRLAETYWCYDVNPHAGELSPLPALTNGHITFGSFNYFSKCNDQVLALWASLLAQMPEARLALHVPAGSREPYVRQVFAQYGIAPQRLTLLPRCKEAVYFQQYQAVDIALDPFPWAGGTTTCDALWMGVPVVTLVEEGAGADTVSRGGLSILTNLGCAEWVARSEGEYVAKARALAGDLGRLAELRQTFRVRMQNSVLMDAPRFARHIEEAYQRAWAAWCAKR